MEEMKTYDHVGRAALRAGMDRTTARKYLTAGKLPSEMARMRTWRTREDPFAEAWSAIETQLREQPQLEAKTIFEQLCEKNPDGYAPGQLRTLQRKIRRWRAEHGPEKEVFFAQEHRPGEAAQTDFTHMGELGILLGGEAFGHLLCVVVLPYSNWQWATVCLSESMAALRRGVQAAMERLGRIPTFHQTDNSTAATHDVSRKKRVFNEDYLALMRHVGLQPRTIAIGKKEQNGDVEASHGALKRRLEQQLLLRGSRDFSSRADYERWVQEQIDQGNRQRQPKLDEELACMRPLEAPRLPEFTEVQTRVSAWSTIRVRHNAYSVPSRLIGERVVVRVYEDRLAIYYAGKQQLEVEALRGRLGHRVNYRHIIWSLLRKPAAFSRYKYREELFPALVFRRAYDALRAGKPERDADVDYLRILHLAASTMQSDVEAALEHLLGQGLLPEADAVKVRVTPPPSLPPPCLEAPCADLGVYDALLRCEVAS